MESTGCFVFGGNPVSGSGRAGNDGSGCDIHEVEILS